MRTLTSSSLLALSLLFLPSFAYAQDEGAESDAPAPPPAAPVAGAGACVLGAHDGIAEADARTAAAIVCGEIVHRGPPRGATYRVGLGRLGRSVILSVTTEPQPGVVADERHLTLADIEEVPVAAPRVAEAIVHGTPLSETVRVDNVVGEEARAPKKRPGAVKFGLGLIGVLPPVTASSVSPAPGIDLDLHYETTRFAAGVGLRGAGSPDHADTKVTYFALTVGGRYYTSDQDVSPYFGGGLAWSWLSLKDAGFSADSSGLGAFGEVGLELLRTHKSHLTIGARLDLPFYSLHQSGYSSSLYTGNGTTSYSSTPSQDRYYAPITIGITFTF